jgi:hypothetical protein
VTAILRALLVLLLVGVLPAVPALAYSEPIEPTWQGGYWEDDDFDYVVLLVTNLQASLPGTTLALQPTIESIAVVPVIVADAPLIERPLPYRRGPPLA